MSERSMTGNREMTDFSLSFTQIQTTCRGLLEFIAAGYTSFLRSVVAIVVLLELTVLGMRNHSRIKS